MKQAILITIAVVAGLWAYYGISSFIEDRGTSDTAVPSPPQQNRDTTGTEADTPATTTEQRAKTPPGAEEAELAGTERFPITGTPEHPASGFVRVIQTPGEQIIRFEDYDGSDGPELHVYLANDLEASNAIDLGPARARSGNINYGVPIDVNIGSYQYVLTWSEEDDELYDYAQIN